ncbi:MAG: hypothetical protein JWN03_5221 [Nocardia sp.]|uniref:hypothetical protein n=1 Tax=Nocardia sp. TaxID=1821 RepID=UPI00262AC237|nr:hypothetical protein [Nocardia sp.]MCU1644946.1 hypothetical protein [Nocardia sp.]
MTGMLDRWDPMDSVPPDHDRFIPDDGTKWAEKRWRNVSGLIYAGQADICWAGRYCAPRSTGTSIAS